MSVGTGQSRHIDGEFRPLYQIRALHDFGDVKAGDLGGYVDGEGALSHEGLCWIADTSCVEVGDSVKKAPLVRGDAQVLAGCVIRGSVVAGGSRIHQSTVYNSVVRGESSVLRAILSHDVILLHVHEVIDSNVDHLKLNK